MEMMSVVTCRRVSHFCSSTEMLSNFFLKVPILILRLNFPGPRSTPPHPLLPIYLPNILSLQSMSSSEYCISFCNLFIIKHFCIQTSFWEVCCISSGTLRFSAQELPTKLCVIPLIPFNNVTSLIHPYAVDLKPYISCFTVFLLVDDIIIQCTWTPKSLVEFGGVDRNGEKYKGVPWIPVN